MQLSLRYGRDWRSRSLYIVIWESSGFKTTYLCLCPYHVTSQPIIIRHRKYPSSIASLQGDTICSWRSEYHDRQTDGCSHSSWQKSCVTPRCYLGLPPRLGKITRRESSHSRTILYKGKSIENAMISNSIPCCQYLLRRLLTRYNRDVVNRVW